MKKLDVSDLVDQGLVKKKSYDNGLSVLKYSKNVLWRNLWDKDSRFLDCRGAVVDSHNNIITMPFTKVFNYMENGTMVDMNKIVIAPRKINGFMASLSKYKGNLLVSTTGTIDSYYANLAKKHIGNPDIDEGFTYLFEICDKEDVHIVDEKEGAYLIGCRRSELGSKLFTEKNLDYQAERMGFMRPNWKRIVFSDLVEEVKEVTHEGSWCDALKPEKHYVK